MWPEALNTLLLKQRQEQCIYSHLKSCALYYILDFSFTGDTILLHFWVNYHHCYIFCKVTFVFKGINTCIHQRDQLCSNCCSPFTLKLFYLFPQAVVSTSFRHQFHKIGGFCCVTIISVITITVVRFLVFLVFLHDL